MLTKKNVPALASTSSEMLDIGLLWRIEEFVSQLKLDRHFIFLIFFNGSSKVLTKKEEGFHNIDDVSVAAVLIFFF